MENSCVIPILDDFFAQMDEEEVYAGEYSEDNCCDKESSKESPYKWFSAAGVSKCAIIPEDSDFVIKFDLDVYDGDCELSCQYAEEEEIISQRAKEKGLSDIFVETTHWGIYRQRNIFLQKKVSCDGEKKQAASDASGSFMREVINKSKQLSKKYQNTGMTSILGAALYNYYGEERFEAILDFLRENHINDLHNGNWGYVEDRPVIFDYSGFNEDGSYYYSSEEVSSGSF